jgi:hypothetical protein
VDGRAIVKLAAGVADVPWRELGATAAGVLFVGSLFLPWQKWCYGMSSDFGPLAGHCLTLNPWTFTTLGAAAGLVAAGLLAAVLELPRLPASVVDLAAMFGLLVITLGVAVDENGGPGFRIEVGYGALIGFATAALLIVLALARSRPPAPRWHRLLVRLAPIAACIGYLAIVVLPWWNIITPFSEAFFAWLSWTTIIGALLAIRLLRLWAQQVAGVASTTELVLLPVALLALAAIDLIAQREAIRWGGGAAACFCLLLVVLGRIEQRQGLENIRIPNALRLDRL